MRILFQGKVAAEVPATALADNTPIYHRELLAEPPEYARKAWEWTPDSLPVCTAAGIEIQGNHKTWNDILLTLLDTPTIASKRWVYRQYDHQVQNNTVMLPGGADAAVIRLRPLVDSNIQNPKSGVAATVDCNPRYVYLNPYEGAKAVVAEAARNLSCVGAEPIAITDNLNFGSPEKPIGYWQLAEACRGIADACREFKTPVTGGNVSLYNETLDSNGNPQPIYPTPVVGMVGLIPDLQQICGQGWQSPGDLIYLLGQRLDAAQGVTLGASEYLATIHGTVAGKPPVVDFDLERQVQAACREGIRQGWVRSAHDCAEGGIAIALSESCISSQLGAEIKLEVRGVDALAASRRVERGVRSENTPHLLRWDNLLFGEGGARILVSIAPDREPIWESYLKDQLGNYWQKIGQVGKADTHLRVLTADSTPVVDVSITNVSDRYHNAIERRLTM